MKINPKIASDIKIFFQDKPVKKVYIFGSFARNEQTEGSDIDILVELDYSQSIGWDFYGWIEELGEILNRKVDLASENMITDLIRESVENDKVLIYERI